jgi:ribosome biogenesis GTPase
MTDGRRCSGVVHETGGGGYSVVLDDESRIEASLRGRLKKEQRTGSRVVIGDEVDVRIVPAAATIESVRERRTELVRRGRGRMPKILAANLDRVFVVIALREPRGSLQLVDRMLVLVESSGMRPVLVLNKADLENTESTSTDWSALYGSIGYRVLVTSASTGEGIPEFHDELCSGSSALIGPSGAGKSTLLNAVDPSLELRTGVLSRKTGTGRHTTVGSRLITLECGGLVADTPGFGDVGLWAVDPKAVGSCFPEFGGPAEECRFRGCTHVHEPGCAVREAMVDGLIAPSRLENYVLMRQEAEEQEGF